MSTLDAVIHHKVVACEVRKGYKGRVTRKEDIKVSLLSDDIVVYVQKPQEIYEIFNK